MGVWGSQDGGLGLWGSQDGGLGVWGSQDGGLGVWDRVSGPSLVPVPEDRRPQYTPDAV